MDPTLQPASSRPAEPAPRPLTPRGSRTGRRRAAAGRLLREVLVAGALVLAAVLPFLVSPHPGPDAETRYLLRPMTIWGPVHINVNGDSGAFLIMAEDPGSVLGEMRIRQNRPLYGVMGWVLALPFRALGFGALGRAVLGDARDPGSGVLYGDYLPYYAAYLLLNWLLLVATLMLFRRLVGAASYRDPRVLLPATVLLVNEVTKGFFWTPHQQIFNVFLPVASLWLFWWMQPRLARMDWRHAAGLGAGLGVASLAYGAFAIPAAGAALLLLVGAAAGTGRALVRRGVRTVALLAAFALPTMAWTAYVVARTGSFYQHEVEVYRQFAWIRDMAARGPGALASALFHNLGEYAHVLGVVAAFPALVVAGLVLAWHLAGAGRPPVSERDRLAGRATLVYLLAHVPFFALMGFYRTRLAWGVVPALLVLAALETGWLHQALRPWGRRALTASAAVVALAYALFWVARYGPFDDTTPAQRMMEHPGFPYHVMAPAAPAADGPLHA